MAEIYAQHTMSVYKVWFNASRNTEEIIVPSSVGEGGLISLFEEFCDSSADAQQVNASERFIKFGEHSQHGDSVLAKYRSGRAGLDVTVLDTDTMADSMHYSEHMAGMVESRMCLMCNPGVGYAVACMESVPNGGGVTTPLTLLKGYIGQKKLRVTMRYEQLQEPNALDAFKGIEKVELRRYWKPDDVGDEPVVNVGTLSHILNHKRGLLMPLALIRDFISDRSKVADLVGVSTDFDGREELYFTLREKDGGSRQFVAGKDFASPLREVLNESGQRPLTDAEFMAKCEESRGRAADILDRMK